MTHFSEYVLIVKRHISVFEQQCTGVKKSKLDTYAWWMYGHTETFSGRG